MQANVKVEVCACVGMDFLRYYGTAVFVDSTAVAEKAFEAVPMLRELYNEQTGNTLGIFCLTEANAEFYGAAGMTVSFSL